MQQRFAFSSEVGDALRNMQLAKYLRVDDLSFAPRRFQDFVLSKRVRVAVAHIRAKPADLKLLPVFPSLG